MWNHNTWSPQWGYKHSQRCRFRLFFVTCLSPLYFGWETHWVPMMLSFLLASLLPSPSGGGTGLELQSGRGDNNWNLSAIHLHYSWPWQQLSFPGLRPWQLPIPGISRPAWGSGHQCTLGPCTEQASRGSVRELTFLGAAVNLWQTEGSWQIKTPEVSSGNEPHCPEQYLAF